MSDIDDLDFIGSAENSYFTEPPGTLPSTLKSSTIGVRQDRKHRRSVSEQVFSKASLHGNGSKGFIRGRLLKRNLLERNPDFDVERETDMENLKEKYSGGNGSLHGYSTGWEYGNMEYGPSAFQDYFSPFERTEETSTPLQSTLGRSFNGGHFRQARRRTVKRALSNSRAEGRKRSIRVTDDGSTKSMNSDGQDEYQRKQSRIHESLIDLFNRVKRSMSEVPLHEENANMLWNCTITIRRAQLKEKAICCVHVYYMETFISKTFFSDETNSPAWNKTIVLPIKDPQEPLELQIIEKHRLQADKLIGRAYIYLRRDERVCSHEAPIKYFSLRKGSSQSLGILYVDTIIENRFLNALDNSTLSGTPDEFELLEEVASPVTSSTYIKKLHLHKKLARKLISHVHRPHLHRSKSRQSTQSSKETFFQSSIRIDGKFVFSPYEATRRYLEGNDTVPTVSVPWRPFFGWPGRLCLQLPMMAFQRHYSARFWELRIPKISWPIEFLLPMKRLALPTSNLMDNLDVGDTVKATKIVQSGIVNIYLVGARGLISIPQVEMVSEKVDEKGLGPMSIVSGSMPTGSVISGYDGTVSNHSIGGTGVNMVSPETRAASLVALHWAAKSLTLKPSPQIEFTYGLEKKSSCIVKNNSNPDFLEEFEFQVNNGDPSCIRIMVYDRETQPGNSGIQRSSIIGESVIDLTTMPLEVTQKMELQILKNSNEARILMFVTITGLATGDSVPVQECPQATSISSPYSMISLSRSQLAFSSSDDYGSDLQNERTDAEDKSDIPNLPPNFLHLVNEHFSFRKSFENSQDIGWMRLKICSAIGLRGKSNIGRAEIFCAVDMFNIHLRTQSIIKHKNPTWNRCFVIPLSDIHGIMKITVVEVDRYRAEIIGGLAIHPLCIDNGGSKWYALKTPDLRGPTKGSILLEVNVIFNQFKAAVKSFSPMELPYRSHTKKQNLLHQRFEHLKPTVELFRWFGKVVDDWWEWKNPVHSILGLIGYQLVVYHFQPYFIPLCMIIILMKNRIYNRDSMDSIINVLKHNKNVAQLASPQEHELYKHQYEILEQTARFSEQRMPNEEGDDFDLYDFEDTVLESSEQPFSGLQSDMLQEEEEKALVPTKSEGKKSMKTRYTGIKDTIRRICEIVEQIASFLERVEGLFKWRIPWLSSLAVIALLILTILLLLVPVRYLLMLWGFNKFTKAILRPNVPRSNEVAAFLSRVPDLIEAVELAEYRPDAFTFTPEGKVRKGKTRKGKEGLSRP